MIDYFFLPCLPQNVYFYISASGTQSQKCLRSDCSIHSSLHFRIQKPEMMFSIQKPLLQRIPDAAWDFIFYIYFKICDMMTDQHRKAKQAFLKRSKALLQCLLLFHISIFNMFARCRETGKDRIAHFFIFDLWRFLKVSGKQVTWFPVFLQGDVCLRDLVDLMSSTPVNSWWWFCSFWQKPDGNQSKEEAVSFWLVNVDPGGLLRIRSSSSMRLDHSAWSRLHHPEEPRSRFYKVLMCEYFLSWRHWRTSMSLDFQPCISDGQTQLVVMETLQKQLRDKQEAFPVECFILAGHTPSASAMPELTSDVWMRNRVLTKLLTSTQRSKHSLPFLFVFTLFPVESWRTNKTKTSSCCSQLYRACLDICTNDNWSGRLLRPNTSWKLTLDVSTDIGCNCLYLNDLRASFSDLLASLAPRTPLWTVPLILLLLGTSDCTWKYGFSLTYLKPGILGSQSLLARWAVKSGRPVPHVTL